MHIPANLLSLGALDFGMVVDGSVIMIENMVRHLTLKDDTRSSEQKIRDAAHEVQRPVFFARGIIIASYLPIFTLQAVEGRLFKPMAWTVSFALVGALVFAILVAPSWKHSLRQGRQRVENPIMKWLTVRYRASVRSPLCTVTLRWASRWRCSPLPSTSRSPGLLVRSFFPISTRFHLGARNIASKRGPHGEHRLHQQSAAGDSVLS